MTSKNGEDDTVVDAISTRTTSITYSVVEKDYTDRDREQSRSETSSSTPQQPQLQYYNVSGDPRSQFGIRQGEVYVERALDREEIGSYSLQVIFVFI